MTAVEQLIYDLRNIDMSIFNDEHCKKYLEMEKQQIIDAQSFAIFNADMSNNRGYFDCEKYYYGTYGGNHIVETNEMIDHIGDANEMVEISDEEIGKGCDENIPLDEADMWSERLYFITGAKWYREQLKGGNNES